MWILPGEASEGSVNASMETFRKIVSDSGGTVKSAALWDCRNLSYPIEKVTEGTYCLAFFSSESDKVSEIDVALRSDPSYMRHLLILSE